MKQPGEHFSEMAEDIARNIEKFGGAFVIVPPMSGGDPIGRLVVSSQGDPSATAVFFWNVVQTEIKAMLDKLSDKERMGAAFGGRR